MERTFKQELVDFNKTGLYLYKVVTAQEVEYAVQFWEVELTDDEYETVCDFIYDWFTSTETDIPEICERFFGELTEGKFSIQDLKDDYSKVEEIVSNSFKYL